MDNYKLITSRNADIGASRKTNVIEPEIMLHENILDILFKHKEEIYRKLIDLKGLLLLDHIAIKIIDPNNRILIFSITPSVEYNLIVQELWRCDKGFSVAFQKNNMFYQWEKAYCKKHFYEIKKIKEQNHGFSCGINLSKSLGVFNLFVCNSKQK